MLTGESTNLRAAGWNDALLIHRWFDDPESMIWWGVAAPAVSLDLIQRRIETWLEEERIHEHPVAFIVEDLDAHAVGFLLLSLLQPIDRNAELSIIIDAAHRRKGLGRDALATLVAAAFDQWGYHRLTVRSEAANTNAHAFFQKNGFRLEGRLREARFIDGGWRDILVFGLIRDDEEYR